MKDTPGQRDFELFQKVFKEYQKLFGLTGYKVYFEYEPLENDFANITIDSSAMKAIVRLSSKLPEKDKPYKDIRGSAKHEAFHLLTGRLNGLASSRYITSGDIGEADEEIAHKLEGLI